MDSALAQAAVVGGALLVGIVLAWGLFTLLGGAKREAGRTARNVRGGTRPEWAPGIWHCAACLSTNPPAATRCGHCKTPRQVLEHDPVEVRPDWIPERVPVATGALVGLVHDAAAHADPSLAHWRLMVGGQVAGSAARRNGALALLRALDGADRISFDIRGTGPADYRLADVIARFEAPAFPLDVACPERARQAR